MYAVYHNRNFGIYISSFVIFNISLPEGVDAKHFKAHLSHLPSLSMFGICLLDAKVKGLIASTHLSALLKRGGRFVSDTLLVKLILLP